MSGRGHLIAEGPQVGEKPNDAPQQGPNQISIEPGRRRAAAAD
jgi:hypothetical protein